MHTVAEMRVSNVDKRIRESEFPVRLCNYVDVYKNDRITLVLPFMNATASREEIERFRLKRGDVLFTKDSEAWDDIGVPSLVVESAYDLLSGYHLALLRSYKELLGPYLARCLQSKSVAYQFHVRARGVTRYGLTHVGIQSVRIPLPPLSEQRAIVRYLDYVDRRIRRYLSAKQRLIDLLEEEKQAIINQAVTRGPDPNVRLKPSGVEWLGDLPEHWAVERLSTSVESQINGVWGSDPDGTDDLPCIRVADFDRRNHRIRTDKLTLRSVKPSERSGRILSKGHLLLEKSGGGEQQPVGTVMLYDHDFQAVCSNFVGRIVLRESYDPTYQTYLHATLYAIGVNKRSIKQTTGIQNIDASSYLSELVRVPPPNELAAIVRYLDKATSDIEAAIARARRQIELVQEYRTRLIADVVTGKLDVREAAEDLLQKPINRNGQ